MASLTIVVEGVGQKFPLDAATVTLGRGLESDIRLKDIKASRRHCQVIKTAKGYQCLDLSSGNGTYVNGVQIKSQILAPGDKITVGSTTIEFEDAPASKTVPKPAGAPAAAKGATGKLPAAPGSPAPASPKTATAKLPTARVQSAPTRKVTARVDAGKPGSHSGLKAAPKSGTRLSKVTSRPPRPSGEATPKKWTPRVLALVGVGVLLLAGLGYFLFGPKDNGAQVREQVEQLVKRGKDAEAADHVDVAIQEYKKALDLCQGDRLKVRASEIRALLQQLDARRTPGTGPSPAARPDSKETHDKGPDFQAKRTEINQKYKLSGDPEGADWGGR